VRFSFNSKQKKLEAQRSGLTALLEQMKHRDATCPIATVRIQNRHHFASALQRMSVVCNVSANARVASRNNVEVFDGQYVLVKGSPEAISRLLAEGAKPDWYDSVYRQLAEDGMRVLALAYKPCGGVDGAQKPREWCENNLTFAGFISFACKTRADSRMVVQALQESGHEVAMITGDAALTALHVARETGIIRNSDTESGSTKRPVLLLEPSPVDGESSKSGARWIRATGSDEERRESVLDFASAPNMRELSKTNDLMATMVRCASVTHRQSRVHDAFRISCAGWS